MANIAIHSSVLSNVVTIQSFFPFVVRDCASNINLPLDSWKDSRPPLRRSALVHPHILLSGDEFPLHLRLILSNEAGVSKSTRRHELESDAPHPNINFHQPTYLGKA